ARWTVRLSRSRAQSTKRLPGGAERNSMGSKRTIQGRGSLWPHTATRYILYVHRSSKVRENLESEPISIVRGEPSELSSILVSASEAPFQRRFVLGLVPLESQAGRDLLSRFDRVAEFPCQIDHIHHCWLA